LCAPECTCPSNRNAYIASPAYHTPLRPACSPPPPSSAHAPLSEPETPIGISGTYRSPLPAVRKVCAHAAIFIHTSGRTCCRQPIRASRVRQGRRRMSMNSKYFNTSTACARTLTNSATPKRQAPHLIYHVYACVRVSSDLSPASLPSLVARVITCVCVSMCLPMSRSCACQLLLLYSVRLHTLGARILVHDVLHDTGYMHVTPRPLRVPGWLLQSPAVTRAMQVPG
jgi:hypothetical protein